MPTHEIPNVRTSMSMVTFLVSLMGLLTVVLRNVELWQAVVLVLCACLSLIWSVHRLLQHSVRLQNQRLIDSFPPVLVNDEPEMTVLSERVSELWVEVDRLESVLAQINVGVIAVNANRFLFFANSAALEFLSCSEQDVGGRIDELDVSPYLFEAIDLGLAGELNQAQLKIGDKPGRRYYELTAIPSSTGEGVVVVLKDVTSVNRLERVRRDFITNVSHELRTPVTIARANAETLMNGAIQDEVYGPRFLKAIYRNMERMAQLIDDLLNLSRIESGREKIELEFVSIDRLLHQVQLLMEDHARNKQHRLTFQNTHPVVFCDEKALERILTNYIDNAIKYCPSGSVIQLNVFSQKNRVRFSVTDNGPGISAKHLSRIFERFYRVDKGRSRDIGGTGLGLSIVKNLAAAMHGKVGADSSVGGGTTFWCEFPVGPLRSHQSIPETDLPFG